MKIPKVTNIILLILTTALFAITPTDVHAVTVDLNSTSSWHLRMDGAVGVDRLGQYTVKSVDLNGNGKADAIIAAAGTDYNSRSASGSVYILYDSLLDDYLTTGNIIDLSNAASYNIRIEGPATNAGIKVAEVADMNNDGSLDIVIGGELIDHNGRSNSGSVYVIYSTIFSGLTGTGNSLDLATATNYNIRFDGAVAGDRLGTHISLGDLDDSGVPDLLASAYPRNASEGSIYFFKDSLLDDYTGTGNNVDVGTTSNFNVRWDGGTAGILFGLGSKAALGDYDGDGDLDVAFSANYTGHNVRPNSGSTWVIFNSLIDTYTGTGNIISLATSTNYSIRFDGSATEKYLDQNLSGTIDSNDGDGLFLKEYGSTGPLYVIGHDILSQYIGTTGNNLDLATSTNYNLAISAASGDFAFFAFLDDITNDTLNDIVIAASSASYNSRANSGSFYVMSGSDLLTYYNTTGNTLTIASESDYAFRVDGAVAGDFQPYLFGAGDFNNDGMIDLFTASQDTDYNSRVNAGSGWIIYSFPHVVTPDDATVATTDTTPTVTGTVVATNSISTISAVEYRVNSNSVLGSWSSCTATDGAFDETSETYTCTLPTQTEGSHTVYFRATDTHTVYTAQSNYGEVALTIDLSGPTYSNVQTAKTDTAVTITYTTNESASTQLEWGTTTSYGTTTSETDTSPRVTSHSVALSGLTKCTTYHFRLLGSDSLGHAGESADFSFRTTGCDSTPSTDTGPGTAQIEFDGDGGVFAPSNGSYTGGQFITAIVEAGTLPFDAYLYALLSFPSNANGSLINPLTGVLPSGGLLTNVVNAGGVLGIRQACGVSWQVAGIQQIWYKTYPSTIIIPEIQLKPSIIALGYTEADLIPLGRPGTRFDPLRLKLAYSPDGITWRILPTSVVDTTNRTVAALHKIGGYYMIVAGCQTGYGYGYGVGTGSKGGIGGSTLIEEIEDDKPTVAPKLGSDTNEEVEDQPVVEQVDEIPSEEPNLFQRILNFFGGLF